MAKIDWELPSRKCDVVMKGGVTSGVVYPHALHELAKTYRLRGLGGTSAGAIGAAFGAAAEYGRSTGGFDKLEEVPGLLKDGELRKLFRPLPRTRPLLEVALDVMAAWRSLRGAARFLKLAQVLFRFGLRASIPGLVVGALVVAVGIVTIVVAVVGPGTEGWSVAAGALVVLSGVGVTALAALVGTLVTALVILGRHVPRNMLGVCTGHSDDAEQPGLTDWMSSQINRLAGLDATAGPLTFGQLWGGSSVDPLQRRIDLRMVSTCLNQRRPYEVPWESRRFFYRRSDWQKLFPAEVMAAFARASSPPMPLDAESTSPAEWTWENELAAQLGIFRFPKPADLPVIVATRLSLSFPLLISAVPVLFLEHASTPYATAKARYHAREVVDPADFGEAFIKMWFTDGGFCSNFPLHMFDTALPMRPPFAFDLQPFPRGSRRRTDEALNSFVAKNNREGLVAPIRRMRSRGFRALADFAIGAFFTARDWNDGSYLTMPGYRDRIAQVYLAKDEGGLNLDMGAPTIERLALRGRLAARKLVKQFDDVSYANGGTGWDNHRWIRYRALMATMPEFLRDFAAGHRLVPDPQSPPSYEFDRVAARPLLAELSTSLVASAERVAAAEPETLAAVRDRPASSGRLRRVSRS